MRQEFNQHPDSDPQKEESDDTNSNTYRLDSFGISLPCKHILSFFLLQVNEPFSVIEQQVSQ